VPALLAYIFVAVARALGVWCCSVVLSFDDARCPEALALYKREVARGLPSLHLERVRAMLHLMDARRRRKFGLAPPPSSLEYPPDRGPNQHVGDSSRGTQLGGGGSSVVSRHSTRGDIHLSARVSSVFFITRT
jgi:hypothetical protein